MNVNQVVLVQQSWDKVRPMADAAAQLFYTRLFAIDPSTQPLFTGDIQEQRRKLMQMLGVVVQGLSKPETILPAIQALGRRHVNYAVQDRHYDSVGAALLWALEQGLGPDFTPETREAWTAAYTLLASIMKDAAHQSASA